MRLMSNMDNPIARSPDQPGVAVIGAGNWGANLVRNLAELGALAAIADSDPQRLAFLSAQYPHISCVSDYCKVLASDIPAVAVATPVRTHYQIVKEALLANKDVFVEKPLTTKPAQAEELQALANRRRLILMVGHIVLFQPAIDWIRDYLRSGALGDIRSIHQERLGLGRIREYENVLWCLGSHDVAVQLFLLERLPEALSVSGQCVHQANIEDDAYLHLEFSGDIQTHAHVSWWWPTRRRRLTVLGSEAMLTYDELEQTVTLHRKRVIEGMHVRDEGEEVLFHGHAEPLKLEMRHFLDCIRSRRLLPADNQYAVDVVRILAAAEQQLRRHGQEPSRLAPIKLPLRESS